MVPGAGSRPSRSVQAAGAPEDCPFASGPTEGPAPPQNLYDAGFDMYSLVIFAREDTMHTEVPEVLVTAPRITLDEILDLVARGEARPG